ncbi:DUF2335 domain-containing protein [Actinotignum sanguinis]|uniref:DUF2335 domain-containing protein n=1 Tax=Actinotignum sanguinis TaxID=1445614 RepID=UPI0025505838|nr:DUF2335 domain-containing protein [Actinotignum sanguinis]MDK8286737.1 DUF2335 domain-containing protein [Actinotignum sanguinis]MDK8352643.1 DUF2335 domain-containing protein [Actinotignum sanguinis]MDK8651574.1 DUF2335 domain-containing protein [Actinotignum sanguinis]MDK8802001.1 DUF2335 domain-containing protein [Actinotignum sanguinis]MDY5135968.1 DUF2335 domain-containing protein [Actinotignum sanguinis]
MSTDDEQTERFQERHGPGNRNLDHSGPIQEIASESRSDKEAEYGRTGLDSNGELAAPGDVRLSQNELNILKYAQFHAGPLPPAHEFAAYEQALPGAAQTILEMAKANQQSIIEDNRRLTQTEKWSSIMISASFALVPLACLGIAAFSVWTGSDAGTWAGFGAAAITSAPKLIAAIKGKSDDESSQN